MKIISLKIELRTTEQNGLYQSTITETSEELEVVKATDGTYFSHNEDHYIIHAGSINKTYGGTTNWRMRKVFSGYCFPGSAEETMRAVLRERLALSVMIDERAALAANKAIKQLEGHHNKLSKNEY